MSEKYEPLLFIGGFADGQLLGVGADLDSADVPEPMEEMTLLASPEVNDKKFDIHRYEKQRLTAGDTIYHVMVYVNIGKDCIGALIEGYKR